MTTTDVARACVLVVDDDDGVRTFLADALADTGHDVTQARDAVAALAAIEARAFHVVLTDLRMPGMDGLALLTRVRQAHPDIEIIVLTAHGSIESAVEAMRAGAFDYLQKPVASPAELRLVVARALERHRLRAWKEASTTTADPPLGYGSPIMRAVEQTLRKVAPTNATVLLLGESGCGKEVAARTIHRWSARAEGPFIAINCAALSESLLESELFGHERGAFTGAHARQRGRIELADGGTFFLDEIGELAPALQAKVLRVLQEKEFERVGGQQTVRADVRWIAATNRKLADMVQRGGFRADLYHRLAVFPVELPPLDRRREDIPTLADGLLARAASALGRPDLRLSDDARHALAHASWPGNIRELANTLERAAIIADGAVIDVVDLNLPSAPPMASRTTGEATDNATTMSALERDAIERALDATGGNRRLAAARLGIGLRTLYDKLKRYGLG